MHTLYSEFIKLFPSETKILFELFAENLFISYNFKTNIVYVCINHAYNVTFCNISLLDVIMF